MKFQIKDTPTHKIVKSEAFNSVFNKKSGEFCRFGATLDDDPKMAPMWEILDWELSTSCDGMMLGCPGICYKGNTPNGDTIDLNTYKLYFDKLKSMNPIWNQVAFGVGSLKYIPHLREILQYTRDNDIIPNITISCFEDYEPGIEAIKELCGACAVSNYSISHTLNQVENLKHNSNLSQVNVHQLLSMETFIDCMNLLHKMNDINKVRHPNPINAVVFLWVKPKGRAVDHFHSVSYDDLKSLIEYATENNVSIGMDSCSAPYCANIYKYLNLYEKVKNSIEFCESSLFSAYFDVSGQFWPCSFCEHHHEIEPIHIDTINTINDLWYSEPFQNFRFNLESNDRECPVFDLSP